MTILVVWSTRGSVMGDEGEVEDHWEHAHTMDAALAKYAELKKQDDLFAASICGVIESTDYDPMIPPLA